MSGSRINVTIDRLVLRGFTPQQRHSVAAELQAELQRLFAASPDVVALGGSRSLASLPHGKLSNVPGAEPAGAGTLAARHIARELKR